MLPKRGDPPERKQADLADAEGKHRQRISLCYRARKWEERAKAYDDFMAVRPVQQLITEEEKEFLAYLRETAKTIREKGKEFVENVKPKELGVEGGIKLLKLGIELEEKAARLADPQREQRRESLRDAIRGIAEVIVTRGLGGVAGGGPRGTIEATERRVRFEVGGAGDGTADTSGEPVGEIPALPGSIRDRGNGSDAHGGGDKPLPSDSK
jgi:hypothetical protein